MAISCVWVLEMCNRGVLQEEQSIDGARAL